MALSAASMATFVKIQMATVPAPDGSAVGAQAYRDALIEALCAGVIQEITANATVSTTGTAAAQTGTIT